MKDEYFLGSSKCALFVTEEVKSITFLDYRKEFGQPNSTFVLKMNFI